MRPSPVKRQLRGSFIAREEDDVNDKRMHCFFCDDQLDKQDSHKTATEDLNTNVRKMATDLRETRLIAKLLSGDMTALDAVYHKKCFTSLYTRHRSF